MNLQNMSKKELINKINADKVIIEGQFKEIELNRKEKYLILLELGCMHLDEGIMTAEEFILLSKCVFKGNEAMVHKELDYEP